MEATEMQEFARQMEESGSAESLTHISLAISILAVLVALVTVLGHRSHTEAVLMQSRAGDAWNEYQAQKIREDNLTVVVDTLSLQPAPSAAVTGKIAEYQAHIARWKTALTEGQAKAHEYEREVIHAEAQAERFDLGEALLQIGVVLSSITLLTRKKSYFLFGLALGASGVLAAASALLVH